MNPLITALESYLGKERLDLLQKVKIGIGGAGGLGSNAAMHLVRSGFKNLVLVDFDKVEAGNLNRQFFFADQLGQYKVYALAENLKRINPDLNLTLHVERITRDNIEGFFTDCDYWIEAFDNVEGKKLFVEAAASLGKRTVSASGLAGWGNTDSIITHKMGSGLVVVGDYQSGISAERPPLSPRVGVAAAKEADVILCWALGNVI